MKTDNIFIDKYRISKLSDRGLVHLVENTFNMDIEDVYRVNCVYKPLCIENQCHYNSISYSKKYGGKVNTGYYFITDVADDKNCVAIRHSVYIDTYGKMIDITPFSDGRPGNVFITNNNIRFKYIECKDNQIQSLGFNI